MEKNTTLSYRQILLRELTQRQSKNAKYSLRAFARDLEIPVAKLSEALNGKCGFSKERAQLIAEKIFLDEAEKELFINLVEQEHARSKTQRQLARARVETITTTLGFQEIDLERFKIISDWHHFAILELTDVEDFKSDTEWIARRLGIAQAVVSEAVQRLLDFGLLKEDKNGHWIQTQANLATPSGIPSREVRQQQSQLLNFAQRSLDQHDLSERDFSTVTLAFDKNDMEKARKLIKEFRRTFNKEMGSAKTKDSVYAIGIQFFPLT